MKANNKKQVLFFSAVLFSISLGIIIPLHFTHAFAEMVGMYVSGHIIAAGLQIVLAISSLILGLAGVVLNWVLSPHFMSLPYTSGGIVEIGWPIVRDFINMFFVLALVVIGLATALRLKEYQVQKALPVLIIIALLINFTPVICGLIVDASNILMNFFLEEISGLQIAANVFSAQGSNLLAMWDDMTALNFGRLAAAPFNLIAKTLIMIIFSLVTAFILFMYALLFIMRYVMIWVLVIVSPIAFFSRIFPKTQKGEYLFKSILGWDEWWKQFIEWTLIGVTAAFFLYLGEQLMVVVSQAGFLQGIPPEGGGWITNIITAPIIEFMNVLLPWGVVLAFLFIGWMIAMDTKALGAKHITDTFKKMGKAMGIAGVKLAPAVMGGMAGGVGKGFHGGTGLSGKYDIKGKGLLGKTRGRLGGAAAGIFTGGFTKKGQEEGIKWAKREIAPPGSIKEKMGKVMGGLKKSFVGEVGMAAYDIAAKEWGFKKKSAGEIDNQEECEAAGYKWIDGKCKGKGGGEKTSKVQRGTQTTLEDFSEPTEKETKTPNRESEIESLKAKQEKIWNKWTDPKTSMEKKKEYQTEWEGIKKEIKSRTEEIDKEIKEEKEWAEDFNENPEDSKKMKKTKKTARNNLEKLTNARENLTKGNREIERIDKEADLLEQEIESSENEKLKEKAEQNLLEKTKIKNKALKKAETIQKKIDEIISKIDESQKKIKAEQDLTAPATPSAAPVMSKMEKLKAKQKEVWKQWNSPRISMEKKEEYQTEFGKIKKEIQSLTKKINKEMKENKEKEEKEKEEKLEKLMKEKLEASRRNK